MAKMIKFVDNHAHLNFNVFKDDLDDVVVRSREAEVAIINVGTQRDTSKRAIEIAEQYNNCYAIVGLHPVHTGKSFHDEKETGPSFTKVSEGEEGGFVSRGEIFDYKYYKELATHPRVVGIGECGLDYYRLEGDTKAVQKQAFEEQIRLSLEVGKPLMLHVREAYEDALDILRQYPEVKGDAHFFAGDINIAKQFLDLGFTLSFTGAITYGTNYKEVIETTPLDRILSETDCPYVAPVPYRGKRNESAYVIEVVKKIAEIKSISLEAVSAQLLANSKRLFNISA